ncbi:MAG: Gfo/Idh/MocA family oxidoreductase [Planctomycetota bacterium]
MEKIRVAVVGLRFGRTWMNGFRHHPQCQIECLCDLDPDRLAGAADETKPRFTTSSLDEVLANDAIDVVALFTPAPLHGKQAAAALRAGKHVLSAVPAADTLDYCRDLWAAARESGRVYMLAENWPYEPSILKAQELYRSGKLGEIYYGEAEYHHHLESLWFTPDGKPTWRHTRDPLLYPTHGIGPYLHMTGDRFVEATGYAVSGKRPPGAEVKKGWLQVAMLRSERGTLFKLLNSFCNVHPGGHYLSFYGDRGSFETARGHEGRTVATYWLLGDETKEMRREKCEYPPLPDYAQGMGAHAGSAVGIIGDFVRAIVEGKPSPIDVTLALNMTLPGICAVESIRTGKPVEIPDPTTDF